MIRALTILTLGAGGAVAQDLAPGDRLRRDLDAAGIPWSSPGEHRWAGWRIRTAAVSGPATDPLRSARARLNAVHGLLQARVQDLGLPALALGHAAILRALPADQSALELVGVPAVIALAAPVAAPATAAWRSAWMADQPAADRAETLLACTPTWDLPVRLWALGAAPAGDQHPRLVALHRLAAGDHDGLRAWAELVRREIAAGDARPDRAAEAEQIVAVLRAQPPAGLERLHFSMGLAVTTRELVPGIPFEESPSDDRDRLGRLGPLALDAGQPVLALVIARHLTTQGTAASTLWRRAARAASCPTTAETLP